MAKNILDIPMSMDRFLRRVFACAHEELKEVELPITPQDIKILMLIHDEKSISTSNLVALTYRDKSQIARKMGEFEKKGLIERTASKSDQRVSMIALSPHGCNVAAQLRKSMHKVFDSVLGPLTQNEKKTLVEILEKVS